MNCVAKKQTTPATSPMTSAPIGPTKPDAGVIVPRPATMPVTMPSTLGLPNLNHSRLIQAVAPAAAPTCVTSMAMPAAPLAASALPALKPNQPTQSSDAPMTVIVRLCGGIAVVGKAAAVADHERGNERRDACVDVHDGAAREVAEAARRTSQPSDAQTQCVDGHVDDDEPEDREQQHRGETRALGETADDQGRRDDRERQLEHREHGLRNRAADRVDLDAAQPSLR